MSKLLLLGFLVFTSGQLTATLSAQSMAEGVERFVVASIRPDATFGQPSAEITPGGGLRATHAPLKMLIEIAYEIRPDQLSGGDGWTDDEQFTVSANGPEGVSSLPAGEQKALAERRLRTLLGERFGLKLKRETQPAPGYVLTVD